MKKYIITGIIAIVLMTSCNDMLDIYPHSAISPDALENRDLPVLENGMYNRCQNMPRESFILNDLLGGMVIGHNTGHNAIDLINKLTQRDDVVIRDTWNGYFLTLNQVNNVLNIASKMEVSTEVNKAKGAAHFFRAYIYLSLVTRWGDVPIIETSNTFHNVPRDPASKVWQFIESDLDKAIGLLKPLSEVGGYYYASQDAALALKARMMLYLGRKNEAAQIAEDFILKEQFRLDDFNKIFRKEGNSEIIFAFLNLTVESGSSISALFYNYDHPNSGSYFYRPTVLVPLLFDNNDNRKDISWGTWGGQICFNKYPSGQTGNDPVILVRIAEMYLISAEAQGLAGISRLNELRQKRGLDPVSVPATEEEYLDLILEERTKELLTENHRYYDLVRTGRAERIGLQDYQKLLPVPESQRSLNPLLGQNEGY